MLPTAGPNGPERRFKATAERFEFRVLPGPFEHFSFPLVSFSVEFRFARHHGGGVTEAEALRTRRRYGRGGVTRQQPVLVQIAL